jgi:sulfoxide reductase catalytic subunit YedY
MGMSKSELGRSIPTREITPERLYLRRRELMTGGVALSALALTRTARGADEGALPAIKKSGWVVNGENQTPFKDITTYNNFYEFGTDKGDPAQNAHTLKTRPWTVTFEGEIKKPQTIDIDSLLKLSPLEERVYRLRCVEAWSMVIPWVGFPLGPLLKRLEPTSKAKYVAFTTLLAPDQMPGQQRGTLDWPYVEGLRIDEAMHPLTLVATGLYGSALPPQNGAPLRLAVPWKYGFKSPKAITHIRLVEQPPVTTWMQAVPSEYGFFGNVNPEVPHPRWSQRRELRLGELAKRPTLPFNGYAAEVASLYAGMDLARHF